MVERFDSLDALVPPSDVIIHMQAYIFKLNSSRHDLGIVIALMSELVASRDPPTDGGAMCKSAI
jgi:hypothetical protein